MDTGNESDGRRLVRVGADGAMLRVFSPRLGKALKRAAQRVDWGDRDAIDRWADDGGALCS